MFTIVQLCKIKCGKVDLRFALSNRLPEMKGCRAFFNATIAGYLARLSSKPWADEIKQVDVSSYNILYS